MEKDSEWVQTVLHIMIKNDLLVYRNVQNNKISLGYFFIITEEEWPGLSHY